MEPDINLFGGASDSLISPQGNPFGANGLFAAPLPPPPAPEANNFREFDDTTAMRRNIYDDVLHAAQTIQPVSNKTHTLRLRDVKYVDPDNYRLKDQKQALLTGQTRGRRLQGVWELLDNATGQLLDSRKQIIASVPFATQRGTFIHRGNEYVMRNQQRLRPGVFTRIKDNGEIEAHANVLPGKGVSHRYHLDPAKGVFYLNIGQSKLPLMPLLKAMGATQRQLIDNWGAELYADNAVKDEPAALKKLAQKLLRPSDLTDNEESIRAALARRFNEMELDPAVTEKTLGKPYERLDLEAILATTRKLVAVSRGEADPDDRDALFYQSIYGPEDMLAERLQRDYKGVQRQLLYKVSGKGDLKRMPSSALQSQLEAALLHSGLGQALEEINPGEILDKLFSVSRLGEGGIPSVDSVPDDARSVQPSHLGFIDPVRTPESMKAGVDLYFARNSRKGRDGKIYTQVQDIHTNQRAWKTPQELSDAVITLPGAMAMPFASVPAMRGGKEVWANKKDIQYVLPSFSEAFSPLANLVPMMSAVKAQRMAMASRMTTQALPLVYAEAPLVQSALPGSRGAASYEETLATKMGAVKAAKDGQVVRIDEDGIDVKYADGSTETLDLYNRFPFNRKTFLHQTPLVKPGQSFTAGQLLAKSNYTDDRGVTALGRNLRTAYASWKGLNFEDAVVISESAAKSLASEHLYHHELESDELTKLGKKNYIGLFPGKYDKKTLERLDENGVVKPGTVVHYGDPLILAARQRVEAANKVHKKGQAGYSDTSVVWEHHDPGVVTDIAEGRDGPVVLVRAQSEVQVGDKLSGRYGDKGVVAQIIPDEEMPQDKQGRPFEILLNPAGIITRTNPAQALELWLGKVARKRGEPIRVEDFDSTRDLTEWVNQQLRDANESDFEDIYDPTHDRKIRGVATGERFFMKLQHTSESKSQGRSGGGYTMEGAPAKGGKNASKRIAMMDTSALLSHGAVETLQDVGAIRGQRNEDYWLQFMQGYTPRTPKVPFVYEKFINMLKAAGVNVTREGSKLHVMALTDRDLNELAGDREIKNSSTVHWGDELKPIPGGLFDKQLTGGHSGTRWAAIRLKEALPNPVMEDPIRRLLGLTKKQFEGVISGEHRLSGHGTGPQAIATALRNIDLDKEIAAARAQIESGAKSKRDQAIRKLGYLKSAKKLGLHPGDWVLSRAPVLPPAFRPVAVMSTGTPLVADPNYLYKELIEANENWKSMENEVGPDNLGQERLATYHAFKAVTGLGDPLSKKLQEKRVQGVLAHVFGSSPKFGMVQRKLLSTTVDNVGRAVITPNPELDMDSIGLPEDLAFSSYAKFVARRLKRRGMPLSQALEQIENRTPLAREALLEEMQERPIYANRAPVLHKFGIMAFRPQLVKGHTLQISPLVVKGFGADFDGDAMNFHVPSKPEAVREAYEKLLPSKSLISPADFKTPVHQPGQEYVGGLYHASTSKSERPVRTFRNRADVRKAFARGELSTNDRIQILE